MNIDVRFHQPNSILGPLSGANSLLAFGRAAALLTATTAAATALIRLANYSASSVRRQGLFGASMGGSAAEGLMLRGFGGAAGLGNEELSSLGEQLGGFNRSARLLGEIDRIRSLNRWEEVLSYTRGRGIEQLQAVWFLSKRQVSALREEASARSTLYNQQQTARAVSFEYERSRFTRTIGDAATGVGGELLGHANRILEGVNNFFGGGVNRAAGGSNLNQAADNLNRAAAQLSGAARSFGGGLRTSGALPAALRGAVLNQALAGGNFFLGDLVP